MDQSARRKVLMLAVRGYEEDDDPYEAALDDQAAAAHAWWGAVPRRFDVVEESMTKRAHLETLLASDPFSSESPEDACVILLTGHGMTAPSGEHFLRYPNVDVSHPRRDHLSTARVVEAALTSPIEHLVFIVNSCQSGANVSSIQRIVRDLPTRDRERQTVAVLTLGEYESAPGTNELGSMLRRVVEALGREGFVGEYLSIDDFFRVASREGGLTVPLQKAHPLAQATGPCLALPNPAFVRHEPAVLDSVVEVASTRVELEYWLDRASGRSGGDDLGWYFTGRQRLVAEVTQFVSGLSGKNLVVTGAAGSGKSALLGRCVTLADTRFRHNRDYAEVMRELISSTPQLVPEEGCVGAAVLARNLSSVEVLKALARHLGVSGSEVEAAGLDTAALRRLILDLGLPPTTVVIDGIDEASNPWTLISDVIAPLGRHPSIRLLVGVRSLAPDLADGSLASAVVNSLGESQVLRTDIDTVSDIADYIVARLSGPDQTVDGRTKDWAAGVAESVAPSFLDARFAATHFERGRVGGAWHGPDWWRETLADGSISLLKRDLDDFGPDGEQALALLVAAANAFGRGVPWSNIWGEMAAAVLDREVPVPDDVVDRVLHGSLSGYLAVEVERGRRVYRPVHERLGQALRDWEGDE